MAHQGSFWLATRPIELICDRLFSFGILLQQFFKEDVFYLNVTWQEMFPRRFHIRKMIKKCGIWAVNFKVVFIIQTSILCSIGMVSFQHPLVYLYAGLYLTQSVWHCNLMTNVVIKATWDAHCSSHDAVVSFSYTTVNSTPCVCLYNFRTQWTCQYNTMSLHGGGGGCIVRTALCLATRPLNWLP